MTQDMSRFFVSFPHSVAGKAGFARAFSLDLPGLLV